ncbi:MFS transporter [Candidatus Pelagibacter sp.]|nr:MFS transporter [Candidatus Pelagibacter sp.]
MMKDKFIQSRLALVTLVSACLVVLISLSVRQVFGMFFMDFNIDLGISNTEFGLAIGIQMLGWGLSGPIFGAIADKYGGHKAIMLAFIFYVLGVFFLYNGPNTGLYFQISLGVLIGIGCGGTAISIPMSIVGKHFPLSNRTIAMSLVTATGSFGYFISPLFTNYSLENNGWVDTLFYFIIFLLIGFVIAFFVRSPNTENNSDSFQSEKQQTTSEALKEAFTNKSYILLISGFFVCGFHITLVGTHVPKYVIDRGLEDWTAAMILSLIGLFNIFGSLLSGYLSAKRSKKIILSVIYFLRGFSIIAFIFLPPSTISSIIFGASFGLLWLSTVPATSGMVAHIFGTRYLGLLYGLVFLSHQIGSFFGAYLGGLFYDLYGSYDYAWYLAIALSVFAALIHLPIKEQAIERIQKA